MNWDNPLTYIVIVGAIGLLITIVTVSIKIGKWVGKVDSFRDSIEPFMKEIRDSLKAISDKIPDSTVKGQSPRQLTALGETIAEELDARTWARESLSLLADRTSTLEEDFEFDALADDYISDEFAPPGEFSRRMRACAYQHGVPLEQVLDVLIVVLRDALLEQRHSETNPATRDKAE